MITIKPDELNQINTLKAINLDDFTCGIYFLYLGSNLIYIGQGRNVLVRIIKHCDTKSNKDFDRCYFMPCNESDLTIYEHSLIKYFRPPANKEIARISLKKANDVICKILGLTPIDYTIYRNENDEDYINSVEAASLLNVSMKILKRLTEFNDIPSYRKKLDKSKHKMDFGRVMYKRKEIESVKTVFSSLHIPLQNEV